MRPLSFLRPGIVTAVLASCLLSLPSCNDSVNGAAPGPSSGSTAATPEAGSSAQRPQQGSQGAAPVPVPFPLTFPVPVQIQALDQDGAYVNTGQDLAFVGGFAILARDEATGDLGVATIGNLPAIGSISPGGRANAGVVMAGAHPNGAWTPQALDLLAAGKSARETVETIVTDPNNLDAGRIFGVLDRDGNSETFIGHIALTHGQDPRTNALSRPNCLAVAIDVGEGYPIARNMLDAFEASNEFPLPERLLLALQAGMDTPAPAGTDEKTFWKHPATSAALLVVREKSGYDDRSDRMVDIRVDLSNVPLIRLIASYEAWVQAVIVPRLGLMIRRINTREPAYKINQEWLRRARGHVPIGMKKKAETGTTTPPETAPENPK